MARRRRKSKGLGYYGLERFAVSGCMKKRIYTNVVDALSAARHQSKTSTKVCKVFHGLPGAERRIATCEQRKCRTSSGKSISMRKLYEAEQGAKPEATGHGKRGRKGRSVAARATKTRLTQYERRQLRRKVEKGS